MCISVCKCILKNVYMYVRKYFPSNLSFVISYPCFCYTMHAHNFTSVLSTTLFGGRRSWWSGKGGEKKLKHLTFFFLPFCRALVFQLYIVIEVNLVLFGLATSIRKLYFSVTPSSVTYQDNLSFPLPLLILLQLNMLLFQGLYSRGSGSYGLIYALNVFISF